MLGAVALIMLAAAISCGSAGDAESTATSEPITAPEPANTPEAVSTPVAVTPTETVQTPLLKGLAGWTNSEPFTIAERTGQGEVVLVDFWTYTCVNCIRTFPFLNEWHDKYADNGLTILGVHTPEFEFERDRDGVLKALERFDLEYPIAQDNERGTWNAFENRAWPAKYLFGVDGDLIYEHIGEGDYVDTEREIRAALTAAGHDVSAIPIGDSDGPEEDDTAYFLTEELYTGYGKVYGLGGSISIAPREYYQQPDRVFDYEDSSQFHHFGKVYLQGRWLNEKDALVHARTTVDLEDYLYAHIFARSANVVVEHRGDGPTDVYVELDGEPVPLEGAGADLEYDEDGGSYIRIDESRLYSLLQLTAFGEHDLVVRSNSDRFAVSSFTFGNYVEGP